MLQSIKTIVTQHSGKLDWTIICNVLFSGINSTLLPSNYRNYTYENNIIDWGSLPIAELINSYYNIDNNNRRRYSLLIIDLDGAEWDALHSLLKSKIFTQFDQIVLRIQ